MKLIKGNSFCEISGASAFETQLITAALTYTDQEAVYELLQVKQKLKIAIFRKNSRMAWGMKARIADLESRTEVCLFKGNQFPTGLLELIQEVLLEHGVEPIIQDIREKPKASLKLPWKNADKFPDRYYQTDMVTLALKHGRGIFEAAVGCHAHNQEILMFDGSIKLVQDIIPGDFLMGPDSKPRKVLRLFNGVEKMCKIIPVKGKAFIVNESHILSLQRTKLRNFYYKRKFKDNRQQKNIDANPIVNISVRDYLLETKYFKDNHKLYRVGVEFSEKTVLIKPYILGIWLGDGTSKEAAVTSMDKEIVQEWKEFGEQIDYCKMVKKSLTNNLASTYFLRNVVDQKANPANKLFRHYNLLGNKHIPLIYKTGSRTQRLELLAGLLDSDGHLTRNTYDIIQKNKILAKDILFLSRSLGFAAYMKKCKKRCGNTNKWGEYYRISISGNTAELPCRLPRKKATSRSQKKNVLRTGFSVESMPMGEYYGYELDSDNLYLLGDFTVTHNTGKTRILQRIIKELQVPTIIIVPSADLKHQLLDSLEEVFGSRYVEELTTAKASKGGKLKPLRVATVQTLAALKKKGLVDRALADLGMVCIDEVHHAGAKTYVDLLPHFDHIYYKFGFTGTFMRNDSKTLDMWGFLSKVLYQYPAGKAVAEGFLTQLSVIIHDVEGRSDKKYQTEYNKNYCGGVALLDKIHQIVETVADSQILILVKQKDAGGKLIHEHLNFLNYDNVYISGDDNKTVIKQALKDFNEKKIRILIGSTIIGEGIDIRSTDCLIMAQGGKSEIAITQATGRAVRLYPGKDLAIVHDFNFQETKYLQNHLIERINIYKKNFDAKITII